MGKTNELPNQQGLDAPFVSNWVSVKDQLPSKEGAILVYEQDSTNNSPWWFNVECYYYEKEDSVWFTHWMDVPKPCC
jgi:hypothetical protein